MTVTGTMVLTRGGTVLALDQRIADALMNYAAQAADAEGVPRQAWCRRVWRLADYDAKHVLKGNASKAIYERILKLPGEHCGWHVGLAVTAAVVGQPIHDFFHDQMRQAAKDAENARQHEQLARAAYRALEGDPPAAGEDRRQGRGAGAVGSQAARGVAR